MKKKTLFTAFLFMGLFCALTGCAKKDEVTAPTEQTLTPVGLDQLEEGCFYVRNEDKFWKPDLPLLRTRQPMPLKIRVYRCPECGMVCDRDLNAAINIKMEGLRLLSA